MQRPIQNLVKRLSGTFCKNSKQVLVADYFYKKLHLILVLHVFTIFTCGSPYEISLGSKYLNN